MESNQDELRHTAAKAFMDSLEQLGKSLQALEESEKPVSPRLAVSQFPESKLDQTEPVAPAIDLAMLEEAAADIEEFIRSQHPKPPLE